MYKSHIKQWGLDKKNKEIEMRAVVRKNRDRIAKGQASTFSIRGKPVDMKAVIRYWERKHISLDEVAAQRAESSTPEQIECITPVPSPIRTPETLAIPEKVLLKLRDFHQGPFGHEISRPRQQRSLDRSNRASNPSFPISGLSDQCHIACERFACNSFEEGRQALEAGFDEIREVVEAGHPNIFPSLFWLATRLDLLGRPEIGLMIFRHFSAMGQILLGPNHPVKLVCGWLASLKNAGQTSFEDAIRRGNQVVCDVLEGVVGPFHMWTTEARFRSISTLASTDVLDFEGLAMSKLQRDCASIRCEKRLGTLCVRLFLAHFNSIRGRFTRIKERDPTERNYVQRIHKSIYVERSFEALAWSLYKLSETKISLTDIETAIDWCVSERGSNGSPVHAWLLVLERWLLSEGRTEGAVQARAKRAMLQPSVDVL